MRRLLLAAAVVVALAGCGGGDKLTVSAASSLRALSDYDAGNVRLGFGGSDDLAAQIRQGAKVDVYAAANTELPDALYRHGLVEKPVVFVSNRMVVAVPSGSKLDSIDDLAQPGVKVAIGSKSVPAGKYARTVISRLDPAEGNAILGNVAAEEPDVKGVIGKVSQGAVDAGFVYVTDVEAADGRVRAVELPRSLQPAVNYAAAVVKRTKHAEDARAYVRGLVDGEGARILRAAGFEPPR